MLRTFFSAACMLASMSNAVHLTSADLPPSAESMHGDELSQVDVEFRTFYNQPESKKALWQKL